MAPLLSFAVVRDYPEPQKRASVPDGVRKVLWLHHAIVHRGQGGDGERTGLGGEWRLTLGMLGHLAHVSKG